MTDKSCECSSDTDIAVGDGQSIAQCQPCTVKNKQMAATLFCETCNEYQCQDCSQIHVLYAFMKSHVLVPIANARSRLSNADLKGFDQCKVHKKTLKYFCQDENKMCCTTCVIDDHRKCTNVKSHATLPVKYTSQECLTVKEKFVELKEKHASTISLVKNALIDIEQQVQGFVKTLDAVRNKIIQRFDDFAQDIIKKSNAIRDQKVQQFIVMMTSFESAYKSLPSEIDFYDHVDKHGTPIEKFMVKHRLQDSLNEYMNATGGPASRIETTNLTLEFDDSVVFLAHSKKVLGLLKESQTKHRKDIQGMKIVERVADSSHTTPSVQRCDLIVSLHVPTKPPCHDNQILFTGMKPTTTKDGLFNFLEGKTGFVPVSLNYHALDKVTTALVKFLKKIDFEKIEEATQKYKLEGATLKASRVPISNCIHVSNLAPGVTKDTVWYYFENAKRSGGGQVDNIVMNNVNNSCLVYFNDYQVIDNVLRKEHKLSEKKWQVYRYLECLSKPEYE